MTEEVRFPIQMVLPTDEIEVPWGDVPSLPLEVIADTEPDPETDWNNYIAGVHEQGEWVDPSHWSNFVNDVHQNPYSPPRIHDSTWIPRHPSSERFHEILGELGDMHDEKSEGYGTDEDPLANVRASAHWGMPAWIGGMLRGHDKIIRLQNYARKGELPFEAVEDAFKDLAVYVIIALVLFEQEQEAKGNIPVVRS